MRKLGTCTLALLVLLTGTAAYAQYKMTSDVDPPGTENAIGGPIQTDDESCEELLDDETASTYFAGSDAGYINGDGGTRRVFGIFGVANSLVFDDCTDATCTGFPYNAPFENNPLLMTVSTGHGPCSFCTVTVQIFVCGSS